MLPAYILAVDVIAKEKELDLDRFRELTFPSLNHLNSLKGAFGRVHDTIEYYHPKDLPEALDDGFCSARGVVLISLGKSRAEHLLKLYQAIVDLIVFELPDFEVRAQISKFEFS